MVEAVNAAEGQLVVVLNLVTQDGETLGLAGGDHIAALHRHAGLDRAGVVVAHRGPLNVPAGVEAVTVEEVPGWEVVSAPCATGSNPPAHDPIRLGAVLGGLVS